MGGKFEPARSVVRTNDRGYVVTGTSWKEFATDADIWVARLDSRGKTVWTGTFGGTAVDQSFAVDRVSDGGYVVAGVTLVKNSGAVRVLKVNSEGKLLWDRVYDGSIFGTASNDVGYDIHRTQDGGLLLTGKFYVKRSRREDVLLMKLSGDGLLTVAGGEE